MTMAHTSSSAETFAIDLKPAPQGGGFEMNWGTTKLTTDFKFAK